MRAPAVFIVFFLFNFQKKNQLHELPCWNGKFDLPVDLEKFSLDIYLLQEWADHQAQLHPAKFKTGSGRADPLSGMSEVEVFTWVADVYNVWFCWRHKKKFPFVVPKKLIPSKLGNSSPSLAEWGGGASRVVSSGCPSGWARDRLSPKRFSEHCFFTLFNCTRQGAVTHRKAFLIPHEYGNWTIMLAK